MEQMVNYIKIEEAAQKWGISRRRVQALCAGGRVPGVVRLGRDWMIPKDAARPTDGRTKAARSAEVQADIPFPRKTPLLYMTDLYDVPGTAVRCAEKLAYHPEAKVLFEAEIAYSRGQINQVYKQANYFLGKHSGFYAILSAGMLLAQCAIWQGDLSMWRRAKLHIAEAPAETDTLRDIVSFTLTAVDSMLYDTTNFPDWFKIGCFEPLHKDALPAVRIYYAKYLYAAAYAVATRELALQGVQGLALMTMLPFTFEPMISQAMADNSVMSELYLRLACAAIYHTGGDDANAIRHLDQAIALALPDRLYGVLAEYGRALDSLLEQRLVLVDPAVWDTVKGLYKIYNAGWAKLSNEVRGRSIITTLSRREREVAKLAAFGMQNSEIAEKLHMSLSGVKQAIRVVAEKTGVGRDEFAAFL